MDLTDLLKYTHKVGASDLHITVGIPPMVRVDGVLKPVEGWPKLMPDHTKALSYSILSKEQIRELEKSRELDLSYGLQSLGRYRLNVYFQRGSVGMAIRVISNRIPSIEELGLPPIIKNFALTDKGLVLVTGPTGSGKSTTLAAMIEYINKNRHGHIMTIEDPIEYLYRHNKCVINQRQIHEDTLSFHEALRRVLRQDPDVVLIGEMRDIETVEVALTLAETGHLVLATLHTSDASQTINRIIDIFPSARQDQIRVQLSFVMVGVVSQQLLPRLNGRGRVLSMEILLANSAVRNMIRENEVHQIQNILETSSKEGMFTMNASLVRLWRDKLISKEVAINKSTNPKQLLRLMEKYQHGMSGPVGGQYRPGGRTG